MAAEGDCSNFPQPGTLKDILDLLGKLDGAGRLKKSVGQKLSEDVEKYCKDATKFYSSSRSSGIFSSVFSNASLIRASILKNSQSSESYGKYNNFDSAHTDHSGCAEKISEALKKFLPQGYAALYYLYFMTSQDCKGSIHGGEWSTNKCHDTSSMLYKWLTDNSAVVRMPELIERGFPQGQLHDSNDGQTVAPVISQILGHDSPAPLQKALSYLLFARAWDESLLGHAICFLYTFCSKVGKPEEGLKEKLKEYSETFKTVCADLQRNLQPFIVGSSGLSAVCKSNSGLFDDLWDHEKFEAYCGWLKTNLPEIIGSLETMSGESSQWRQDKVQNANTPGPFRFGFVFKDSWNDYTFKNGLSTYTSPLTDAVPCSLNELKECLENVSSGSSGVTAGGAAGGILGAGGLGFGAAYATNAFGLKDIISGLIAGLIK